MELPPLLAVPPWLRTTSVLRGALLPLQANGDPTRRFNQWATTRQRDQNLDIHTALRAGGTP